MELPQWSSINAVQGVLLALSLSFLYVGFIVFRQMLEGVLILCLVHWERFLLSLFPPTRQIPWTLSGQGFKMAFVLPYTQRRPTCLDLAKPPDLRLCLPPPPQRTPFRLTHRLAGHL